MTGRLFRLVRCHTTVRVDRSMSGVGAVAVIAGSGRLSIAGPLCGRTGVIVNDGRVSGGCSVGVVGWLRWRPAFSTELLEQRPAPGGHVRFSSIHRPILTAPPGDYKDHRLVPGRLLNAPWTGRPGMFHVKRASAVPSNRGGT